MELGWNEKKIQALFHELKLADESVAPEFKRVWNRAQTIRPGSSRVFKVSVAVATVLFVITLSSLLLWSQNWQRSQPSDPAIAAGPATNGLMPAPPPATPLSSRPTHPGGTEPPVRVRSNRGDRKVAARRHPNLNARNVAIREADSISSWQSPTAMLMRSPADNVLTSLPQLDRSLTELRTFLPNTPQ